MLNTANSSRRFDMNSLHGYFETPCVTKSAILSAKNNLQGVFNPQGILVETYLLSGAGYSKPV